MRESTVPPLTSGPPSGDLSALVADAAAQEPDRALFSRKEAGRWVDVSARRFHEEVTEVARGLVASGVQAGDRVALMSRTRYEWTLCDFAIWAAGAVTVPVYETSSAEQVQWMLEDSGAVAAFVEAPEHAALVAEVAPPAVRHTWTFQTGGLDALREAGREVPAEEVARRSAGLSADSLATIIYTSGTTGRPKGCELTHGNFLHELHAGTTQLAPLFQGERASTLLFLPLAHVFARIIQVGCVMARTRLGHSADVTQLLDDLQTFRPTFILSVPRVFEKIYNSSAQKAEASGRGRVFHAAADTAIAYSRALETGRPGIGLRARHAVFDRLVYGKLRAALGGEVRYAVSGGAALGERLGHFFRGIGLVVLEGYGLTETTAAATTTTPDHLRIGTVGRPLAGTAVRLSETGEVLYRGPNVFRGYWRNERATAEAFEDGWFRTGDIGELDADGYLRITGRAKEIIVTAAGKNVAPAVLEDRLRAHPLVSQCMVVGDGQPFIAALITLDPEALPTWLQAHDKPVRPAAEVVDDPDVRAEVQRAVDEANKAVSRAEAIKKFALLTVDFTEAGGQLTPSLKLKRTVVLKDFAGEVDALYR